MHMLLTLAAGIVAVCTTSAIFGAGFGSSQDQLDTDATTTASSYFLPCLCCLLVVLVRLVTSTSRIQIYIGQPDSETPSVIHSHPDETRNISVTATDAINIADTSNNNSFYIFPKVTASGFAIPFKFNRSVSIAAQNTAISGRSIILSFYSGKRSVSESTVIFTTANPYGYNIGSKSDFNQIVAGKGSLFNRIAPKIVTEPVLTFSGSKKRLGVNIRARRQSVSDNRIIDKSSNNIDKSSNNIDNPVNDIDNVNTSNFTNFGANRMVNADNIVVDSNNSSIDINYQDDNKEHVFDNISEIPLVNVTATSAHDNRTNQMRPNGHSSDSVHHDQCNGNALPGSAFDGINCEISTKRSTNVVLVLAVFLAVILTTVGIVGCAISRYNHHYFHLNRNSSITAAPLGQGSSSMGIRTSSSPNLFSRAQLHHHVYSPATNVRNPNRINSPATVPMLTLEANIERERCAHRDRQVRLQSVKMDFELGLPPMIQLPDGEEVPYGSSTRLHIRDREQESEIYRNYIKAPPNRTIQESENNILPFRSSSAGFLSVSNSTNRNVASHGEWTDNMIRCHSMSSRCTASHLPPILLPATKQRHISRDLTKITMVPCLTNSVISSSSLSSSSLSSTTSTVDSRCTTTTTLSTASGNQVVRQV